MAQHGKGLMGFGFMAPVLPLGRGQFTSARKVLGLRGGPFLWTHSPCYGFQGIQGLGAFWEMRSTESLLLPCSARIPGYKWSSKALELSHLPNPMNLSRA